MSGERRVLGRSVARLEDLPLLRGQGQFVGDITFPHQLHMRIVRSPFAHGELARIIHEAGEGAFL
jgi:aerobic carbon-monoxide dehydrogenase large subunit